MNKSIKLNRKAAGRDYYAPTNYRVKLFSHVGIYPIGAFCTPTGLFYADDDIAFAVTIGPTWSSSGSHLPYSEADWLQPQLVRLLASLIFTEQFPEGPRCRFYPHVYNDFILNEKDLDLLNPRTATAIKKSLLGTVNNRLWTRQREQFWDMYLGHRFNLFDRSELSMEMQQKYWEALDTENFVMMRAIQALIKSDMLAAHHEFVEEATIATFIALDASFELVLRHLKNCGKTNPNALDAGNWLYETFDKPLGVHGGKDFKYFEEFYEQRIQTIHPGSRYGDMPVAPISSDDQIHLRQSLPGVLAFLVLGEHAPYFRKLFASISSA